MVEAAVTQASVMTAGLAPQPAADQDEAPDPLYGSVQDWVARQFLPMYRRPLGGEYRWCTQWWRHAEAITRLTALWQSWEAMRLQPGTGMISWLRDCLDHQLPVLLGRGGPFAACSEDEHIDPRTAAADPPPPGWWDTGSDDPGTEDEAGGTHLPPGPAPHSGVPGDHAPDAPDGGAAGEQP
jgi:hypothetical protein